MTAMEVALSPYKGNILEFDILAGKRWYLPNGRVWSFGSRGAEATHENFTSCPCTTTISNNLCLAMSAAKWGISEVITDLEKRQIVNRTHSPYNSPVWLVRKPDGWWCLTIDYRRLKSNTPPLTAAVLSITSVVTAIQAAAHLWVATLDIKDIVFYYSPKGGRQSPVCLYLGRDAVWL